MTIHHALAGRPGHPTSAAAAVLLAIACGGPPPDRCAEPVAADHCVTVTIPRGAPFAAAVESLAVGGVIDSRLTFSLYGRVWGLPAELKSGTYRFPTGARYRDVARVLRVGRGVEVRWSVPEGMMLSEVAALAEARLDIPAESVLAAARDPAVLAKLQLTGIASSAEGYLFPTTYQLPIGIDARGLVDVMTDEFRDNWSSTWNARLAELGMARHQIVTLASIVESEVRYAPDREYVAAVYHNRLRRGMPLQADPTVIYAHGRRLSRVWERHLRITSPYNTYLHPGLPPGPISQPGRASLEAALYPKRVPYLYFVAQRDGKHVFSSTYAEHLEAIRAIRGARRR